MKFIEIGRKARARAGAAGGVSLEEALLEFGDGCVARDDTTCYCTACYILCSGGGREGGGVAKRKREGEFFDRGPLGSGHDGMSTGTASSAASIGKERDGE